MNDDSPFSLPDGDPLVASLSQLARRALPGDAPRRDDASFARVEFKVERGNARRRLAVRFTYAAAALVLLLAGGSWLLGREKPVTYSVVNGAVVDGDRIIGGAATRVRFSEGSELTLEPGAETRINTLDEHGGHLSLREGSAKVAIAKRPGAAWTLAAGPYAIRVTGTAFALRWSQRQQAFEISMQSGSVVVTGPLAGSGITLKAGQRLRSSVPDGKLAVEANGAGSDSAALPDKSLTAQDPNALLSGATDDSAATDRGSATTRGELSWAQTAAAGDFNAVIDAAKARGIAATLASASLSDLSALADSARYLRRTDLARRALLAQRSRFAKSGAARDAAFFLGRLAQDEGAGGAVEWYDRYLAESPRGPYVAQALGRKMMIVYRQRGSEGARQIARDYLERFPSGPYAAVADSIVHEAK
jgi:hypothetical protein